MTQAIVGKWLLNEKRVELDVDTIEWTIQCHAYGNLLRWRPWHGYRYTLDGYLLNRGSSTEASAFFAELDDPAAFKDRDSPAFHQDDYMGDKNRLADLVIAHLRPYPEPLTRLYTDVWCSRYSKTGDMKLYKALVELGFGAEPATFDSFPVDKCADFMSAIATLATPALFIDRYAQRAPDLCASYLICANRGDLWAGRYYADVLLFLPFRTHHAVVVQ